MTPYGQGWNFALIKLGLSASAGAAVGGGAGFKAPTTGATTGATTAAPKVPKPQTPWSAQNKMEPKMHETAWQKAQRSLDTGESRAMGKVDISQRGSQLATGSV